jgi:hypothetical protein
MNIPKKIRAKGVDREFKIWQGIKQRCTSKNHSNYPTYGGAGITICERWRTSFEFFLEDVGKRPREGMQIDRIDGTKGYVPGNVRWVTPIEQANNRKNNHRLTYKGKTLTVSQWARELGVNLSGLWSRIYYGWTDEEILSRPFRTYSKIKTATGIPVAE